VAGPSGRADHSQSGRAVRSVTETMDRPLDRSRRITEDAVRLLPGGVSSSLRTVDPPRVFIRAKGSRLWDADGNEYIDFHCAFGPIILGHADEAVRARAMAAIDELDIVGAGATLLEIALARKIQEHVPSAERVLFSNSGTEATFQAIRVARAATGRKLLVKFQGCYHGWHDYVAANVISRPERVGTIDPISAGVLPQALDWLAVLPFNDVDALETFMARRGQEVAAVILEPVIHTIGCVPSSAEFVAALRRTTAEQGAILIFDEVVTGFRHDLGGYQGIMGVRPDLTTFAKAIANGYPLAVVCGRADLMERFNTTTSGDVLFGGTYNGGPLSMAAGLATIEALEADDRAIHRRLFALGEQMRVGLQQICDRLGITARAVNFGSVFVVYFTDREVRNFDDALTSDAELYVGFHRGMSARGFLMPQMNLKRNHLTGAHTAEDVDRTLEAAEDVLAELKARHTRAPGRLPAAVAG
jgi:glutamate-1-semialdehyde 2,1-aminomutase